MKTRCYTPTVQQLCNQWDQKFILLREDLAYYQQDIATSTETATPFDRFEKRSQISATLEERCVKSAHKYDCVINTNLLMIFTIIYLFFFCTD